MLGELIAELNSSHTYRSGGEVEKGPSLGVGYLGCDYSLENGAYRIKHIVTSGGLGQRSALALAPAGRHERA